MVVDRQKSMTPGPRYHASASLRIAICEALPEPMHAGTREIINLRCANPRKGHATALMAEVCLEADKASIVLITQPGQFDDGMTTEQLTKWYGRMGFVALPHEPDMPQLMARQVVKLEKV